MRDNTRYNPAIDTAVFPGTLAAGYWSSSTNVYDTYYAWYVPFYDGHVSSYDKTSTYYVRCVR